MTNGDDASQEARYDEIVNKLEALLQKHKGKALGATAAGGAKGYLTTLAGAAGARSIASDDIPTLTETVHIAPTLLSPQSDITSLLGQILDSALKDAGVDLEVAARKALVQALESQLFGL
jgi:hypothetical protein